MVFGICVGTTHTPLYRMHYKIPQPLISPVSTLALVPLPPRPNSSPPHHLNPAFKPLHYIAAHLLSQFAARTFTPRVGV